MTWLEASDSDGSRADAAELLRWHERYTDVEDLVAVAPFRTIVALRARRLWRPNRRVLVVSASFATLVTGLLVIVFWRPSATTDAPPGSHTARAIRDSLAEVAVTQPAPGGPRPTMFCWSYMEPGPQEELVEAQLAKQAGIFACNEFAVLSSERITLGGNDSELETWYVPNTAHVTPRNNSQLYVDAWNILWGSGKLWAYDFAVKVEVETVFFAYRLREQVRAWVGLNVYFPNCPVHDIYGGPQMFGSLEVYSTSALHQYMATLPVCLQAFGVMAEDAFMKRCMDMAGVKQTSVLDMGDARCTNTSSCTDLASVAFSGHGTPHAWTACFHDAQTTTSTTATTSTSTTGTTTYTTTHPPGPSPTLFCWSRVVLGGYEEELIKMQFDERVSIFACNDFAVITSSRFVIGHIGGAPVETWYNPEKLAPMGQYGVNGQKTDSFLNTQVFLEAWDTLMNSQKIWPFDFVVKVDPDAVFFPTRLRRHVLEHTGQSVYVANCGKWASGPKLYGSMEVFSIQALRMYERRVNDCKALPWTGWGEDYYMQHCMDLLGVEQVSDFQQVGDDRCVAAPCSDWMKVAFHPFKDVDGWFECWNASHTTTSTTSTTTTATTTTRTTTTPTTTTRTITTTQVTGPSPTLFCWSHMKPGGPEEALVNFQFARRASIFACNGYAVICPKRMILGNITGSYTETWYIEETEVSMGQYGVNGQKTDSYLNTKTFLAAWDTLISSQQVWAYDFIVKVDPDAVFFPDRLREHLKYHVGYSMYVPNCGKWASGPKLYGSLEVISVPAFRLYAQRVDDCKQLPWHGWGEDYYLQHCMDMIGVQQVPDFMQVGDERCVAAPCSDWTRVAFHPFKDLDTWTACFKIAIGEK